MKSVQLKPLQLNTKCVLTMIKPLRIFQFLVVSLIFTFTVWMIFMERTPISALACILLIVLSGVYVFVLAVELIGQFSKGGSPIFPMFAFSLLAVFFFSIAGILLLLYGYIEQPLQIAALTLCLLAATIFLIDITLMFTFWKKKCSHCRRCCNDATEVLFRKSDEPKLTSVEVTQIKQDTTTSISDVRLPSELEKIATEISLPEHCYRKVQNARRRQYVDCPTCVPSLCNLGIAQIQTEPKKMSVVEIQTPTAVTKEAPMQTLSKCEFCQRMMQPGDDASGCGPLCSQDPSQWTTYPAILQIVRGMPIGMPCCPKCKCSNDATQTQQQPQSTREHTKWHTQQVSASSHKDDTLTSERTEQVASKSDIMIKSFNNSGSVNTTDKEVMTLMTESITPTTLYMTFTKRYPSNLHVDPVYKEKVEITDAREDTKQTDDEASARDGDRILARETIATIATAEKSKRDLMSVKPVAEQQRENTLVTLQEEETREENIAEHESLIDQEKIEKGETSIKEEEYNDSLIERSKGGGGEEGIRMWQQFMCITEQGNMAKIKQSPRPSVSTQVSTTQIISPTRRVSRTSKMFPHLKLNKVDPIGNINIFDENRISGRPKHETSETAHLNRIKRDGFAELSSPVERQDACSFCERQKSFTPISSNRYYSVYMDKKRYLCELCAPLYCKKVIRKIHVTYAKRLRCSNCGVSLQVIETKVPLKSKACPKCGRSQEHAFSRSSM